MVYSKKATGNIDDLHNGTYLDCASKNCTFGIYYDYQVKIENELKSFRLTSVFNRQ